MPQELSTIDQLILLISNILPLCHPEEHYIGKVTYGDGDEKCTYSITIRCQQFILLSKKDTCGTCTHIVAATFPRAIFNYYSERQNAAQATYEIISKGLTKYYQPQRP